jgi:hypothetical protein
MADELFTRNASSETELIKPVFVTVRFKPPVVLLIARAAPVCSIVPLLTSVVDVPFMVSATVPPLMLMAPPLSTVPMPLESVCAPVVVPFGIGLGPGTKSATAMFALRKRDAMARAMEFLGRGSVRRDMMLVFIFCILPFGCGRFS